MADSNPLNNIPNRVQSAIPMARIAEASAEEIKIYESFLREITDADDAPPDCACRDAKYFLTLQAEKMKSLDISVKEELRKAGAMTSIKGAVYDSPAYVGHRLHDGYNRKITYYQGGKKIYSFRENLVLHQMLIDAKNGISHDETYICPSCGGISTIAELENGCQYCGTRFLMTELFPKVTEHFWAHDYSWSKKDMNKRLLRFMGTGFAVGAVLGGILGAFGKAAGIIYGAISGGILGIIGGFTASSIMLFMRVMVDAVKSIGTLSKTWGGKARVEAALRQADPDFFYEFFESRVISLLKIMLFSNDISDSAVYCGDKPVRRSDVIEAMPRAPLMIHNIDMSGENVRIDLTVFTDSFHYKNGRIKRKNDEYRMSIFRDKSVVTDHGFSIIKVECPSCGGSFNAAQTKHCPFCGRDYDLSKHDWTVYRFG